jgi:hypothetical protein
MGVAPEGGSELMGYMVRLGYLVGPVVPRDRVCVGSRGSEQLDHLDHVDHVFDTTDPAQRPPSREGGVPREPEMIPNMRRTRAAGWGSPDRGSRRGQRHPGAFGTLGDADCGHRSEPDTTD